mgnify:CR=1 FL=1
MKPTIKDVAKLAHVSTATVSRVLANKKGITRPETAARIRQAAHKLGYHKNVGAAQLAANSNNTIAVIINQTPTNFWQEIVDGILAQAKKRHQKVIIFSAGNHNSNQVTETVNDALSRQVAGIILVSAKVNPQQLAILQRSHVPYRFASIYDVNQAGIIFISSDNVVIGETATNYLIRHHHRRIGLVGIDRSTTGQQRILGYQKAMTEAGLIIEPGWIIYGDYSYQNGQELMDQVHDAGLTAIITGSDMVAAGLLTRGRKLGIKVPQDLSIVSIDGTFICEITNPPLTSITQNFFRMGVESLNSLLDNEASTFIPSHLTKRESVRDNDQK